MRIPLIAGLWTPRPTVVRGWAIASVAANVAIVVTGGLVRLTGSGLGCPTWPSCTEGSLTPTPEYGIHGDIEFGNRLLTFALAVIALLTLVTALRARPRRRDWRILAVVLFLGVPAQAVLGGITVLTNLNPWVVMLHFLLSMGMVALSVVLVQRTRESWAPPRLLVPAVLHRLGLGLLATLAAVLYLGAVVTGSGPHAGDADSPRTGLDPELMSQLHADAVLFLLGLTVAMLAALYAVGAPARAKHAFLVLLVAELGQGVIGYTQYFLHLPVALVAAHMLGAGVLVAAATHAVLTLRLRGEAVVPTQDLPSRSAVLTNS